MRAILTIRIWTKVENPILDKIRLITKDMTAIDLTCRKCINTGTKQDTYTYRLEEILLNDEPGNGKIDMIQDASVKLMIFKSESVNSPIYAKPVEMELIDDENEKSLKLNSIKIMKPCLGRWKNKKTIMTETFDAAVKSHKRMWELIEKETKETGHFTPKRKILQKEFGEPDLLFSCFACEYAAKRYMEETGECYSVKTFINTNEWCRYCPLQFIPKEEQEHLIEHTDENKPCLAKDSPFRAYDSLSDQYGYNDPPYIFTGSKLDKLIRICKQMANLPINPDITKREDE